MLSPWITSLNHTSKNTSLYTYTLFIFILNTYFLSWHNNYSSASQTFKEKNIQGLCKSWSKIPIYQKVPKNIIFLLRWETEGAVCCNFSACLWPVTYIYCTVYAYKYTYGTQHNNSSRILNYCWIPYFLVKSKKRKQKPHRRNTFVEKKSFQIQLQ